MKSLTPVAVLLLVCGAPVFAADSVSFSKDISPLIESKCLACHSAAQKLSELDLSSRAGMLKGGVRGPSVVPGDPENSPLYRFVAGLENPRMPLGGELPAEQQEVIKLWIEQGAVLDGAVQTSQAEKKEEETWWAFVPPRKATPPEVGDARWSRNPIDRFLYAELEKKGVAPAPKADKRTLIRRAYLDLVGLLPEPAAVEEFVADESPDAWANLIDELLASPHYGERWGRHWLDVVRYADSSGYEHDYDQPDAWRFRDYVIQSFNEDKPYDRFVLEQLAGDELHDWDFASLTATGFYRIGPRILFREKDNPDYRYTYLDDMIQTASRAFMGLSVECARCHDHKFDPIQQKDYYRMMAIFFPYIRYDHPLASPEAIAEHERKTAEVKALTEPLEASIDEIEAPYKEKARAEKIAEFPEDIQEAVATPEEERTEGQKLLAAQVLSIGVGSVEKRLSEADAAEIAELKKKVAELEKNLPEPLPTAMGIRDGDFRSAPDGRGDEPQPGKGDRQDYDNAGPFIPSPGEFYEPPPAHFLPTADYRNKGEVIDPGLPSALARPADFRPQAPDNGRVSSGRRRALAEWLASEDHPLTARVMVNRIWQHHFGEGIVGTANNFGKMGLRPKNLALLDWLAEEFVDQGWSVKAMHRAIMTTEAYQMASAYTSEAVVAADPENRLLWRYPQRRLESEIIRDVILDAAGTLNLEAGGIPYFPPVPDEVLASFPKGRWVKNEQGPAVWRRSVYSYYKRGLRYPMFDVFDQPNMNVSCERRTTTTVPTQALTLLNNELILEQAAYFAGRVWRAAGADSTRQIDQAYRVALSRPPSERELEGNRAFLARQRDYHAEANNPNLAALTDLCDVILNLNEFVYIQ